MLFTQFLPTLWISEWKFLGKIKLPKEEENLWDNVIVQKNESNKSSTKHFFSNQNSIFFSPSTWRMRRCLLQIWQILLFCEKSEICKKIVCAGRRRKSLTKKCVSSRMSNIWMHRWIRNALSSICQLCREEENPKSGWPDESAKKSPKILPNPSFVQINAWP
jgi:hypothetical protein